MLKEIKKIEPFYVEIEGEKIVITQEMIDETDEKIMKEYRDMLWAERQRERRELRCLNFDGTHCIKKKCSECEKNRTGEKLNGKPLSLDKMQEKGVPIRVCSSATLVENHILEKEQRKALYDVIDTLDEKKQNIMRLHIKGLSDHEISRQTGIPQTTVTYRKNRGIKDIKEKLKDF